MRMLLFLAVLLSIGCSTLDEKEKRAKRADAAADKSWRDWQRCKSDYF